MPLAPDDPFAALGATTEEAEAPASKPGADPFAELGAEDEGSFIKKSVADPEFDPMGYALESGDHQTAKEIAWQKRSQPMTAQRFGGLVKKFGGAAVDMVKDFGGGLGAVAIDSAEALSTPDAPFWQKQGIDPDTAKTIIERAKTQNLLRAQLAEEHGSGFMSKIFGSNGVLAPVARKLTKWSANASGDVPAEDADAAVSSMNKEEEDRKNNPRPYFDAKFDEALAHAKKANEIEHGQIQQDDLVAKGLKGVDYATQRMAGAKPEDINPQLYFESPEDLAKENAPIDPESIQKGSVAIDPVNLLPLHIPGSAPVLNKVAGAGLRVAAAPFRGAAWAAEHIPAVGKKLGSIGKYGLGVEALAHPAYTAKALAGYAGTRVIGHVLDTAGQKLMNPKFVSQAERAAAEEVMDAGKRGFISGAQNLADAERMASRVAGGAAAAPVAMAPLNYAISDTPEEFAGMEGGVAGFGGLAGGLGYHPVHGFRPETIQAVDSVLQEKGAAKNYGTDLDAAHNAYMANAPDWVKAGVNAYRGFFDGFRFANGKEPEIYVLPRDQFAAEAAKDNPSITPELAAQQRGFKSGDGKVVVNGDYGQGGGTEAPSVLGHEAGGHVAQTIIQLLAPELDSAINKHATRNLLTDAGRPTLKLQRFIDAYNKAFDPTGQHVEIQNNEHAIQEFLAEQGRQAMEGGGPAKFAAGKALRETMQDNIADYFRKLFGTKHKFDRSEVPTLAREYRQMLFEMGRLRAMNEAYAPPTPEQDTPQPAQAPPAAQPPLAQAPGGANDRGAVLAALRALGWPATQAQQMAAAAQGANVEEMVKDALARKQPTPLTPAAAPAPLPAAQNAPTGQLGSFSAPAGAPAAVAEASKTDLSDFNPNESSSTPSGQPPTSGTPVPPGNGPADISTPGVEPISAVSPDDITGALIQAEQGVQEKADRARSGAKKAAIIRQARVDALSKMLPAEGEGLKPVEHPETGEVSFRGEVDPENPVHAAILNEFGYTPEHIASLLDLQAKKGQGVYLRDYNAAAQEGHETGEGLELTGEKRNKEYEASPTGDVGQRQGAVTKQDKAFTPYETVLTNKGVLIRGFDHDKFLGNLRSIVDAIKGLGGETPDYSDSEIADAFRKVAENHANGWKGDGSDQLQTFPDSGIKQNLDYVGQPVSKDLADIINMAMHIRSSRPPKPARGNTELAQKRYAAAADTAKEAQGLAKLNNGYLNPETGETNALRDLLEANGFDTDKELKPTISNVRPDLIEGGIHDTPTHGRNVHAHGFDISPADLTTSGTPRAKQTSAGFMPGDGELSDFGAPKDEPSIKSKVTNSPEFKNWFGDSKVVDKDGNPIVLHHAGHFDETEDGVPEIGDQGFHFGTERAAEDRQGAKPVDDFIKDMEVTEHEGRWYWQSQGVDSYDMDEEGYATEDAARRAGETFATEQDNGGFDEPMPTTQAYLSIKNPMRTTDHKDDWSGVIQKAKEKGHDGIVYRNEFEDKGSQSYIAFEPSQIKSVNNEGSFDPSNPDIRFMPGEKDNDRSREVLDDARSMSTLPSIMGGPISLSELSGDWHINKKVGDAMVEWVHAFRKDPTPRTEAAFKLWGDAVSDFAASLPDRLTKDARTGKLGDPFARVKERFPDGSKKDLADSIRSMYDLAKDGIGKNAMGNMVARDYLNLVELIDMEGIAEMTPKLQKLYDELNKATYGSDKKTKDVLADFAAEEEGGHMLGESEKVDAPGIGVQYKSNDGFMPGGDRQLEMFDGKDVESEKPSRWKADGYKKAGDTVDGREVINADKIPNRDSISAELGSDYEILPGVREVPVSDFPGLNGKHYSVQGQKRIDDLADAIKESKQITPLIVAEDAEGPYVLEGATRAEALFNLGAKSFPALVVKDTSHGDAHFMPGESGGKALEDFDTDDLGFYSGLKQVIDKKIPNRASGDQILATLKGAGAKQEEMDALGLPEYLKTHDGPVTKQELAEFVKSGGIKLEEVTKSSNEPFDPDSIEVRPSDFTWTEKPASEIHSRRDIDDPEETVIVGRHPEDDSSFTIRKTPESEKRYIHSDYIVEGDWGDPFEADSIQDAKDISASFVQQNLRDRASERPEDGGRENETKFSQYTLPGGDNYKEILLTLPSSRAKFEKSFKAKYDIRPTTAEEKARGVQADYVASYKNSPNDRVAGGSSPEEVLSSAFERFSGGVVDPTAFRSSHWDEPNVLAHIRQADYTDTEGSKVRLIEEIQSDWHQQGRKKGYKGKEVKSAQDRNVEIDKELNAIAKRAFPGQVIHPFDIAGILERNSRMGIETGIPKDEIDAAAARARELTTEWNEQIHPAMKFDSVPDAPFKKTWQELAFKRALRLAVDDGMDKIAWTTGDQNAERYDLSKQISKVRFDPESNELEAFDHSGHRVMSEKLDSPEQIEDYIGKEPAKKLAEKIQEWEQDTEFTGYETEKDEESGKWVIVDPNGEYVHGFGGDLESFSTEDRAKEHIETMAADQKARAPRPRLEGLDLKVGGEGMKGFYDKILPDFVRKYVKKWGGKVETTKLTNTGQGWASGTDVMTDLGIPESEQNQYWKSLDEEERADLMAEYRGNKEGAEVHSVTITPEMREAISKGQPMFMPGDQSGQLSSFGKEDMDRHAEAAGAVYQGRQNDLHAFKELSTGGNYSLKDAEATPENIQGRADKVRDSFKQDTPAITEDNLDEWLKANGFLGDKSKEAEKPLSNFMPGGDEKPLTRFERDENFAKWAGEDAQIIEHPLGEDIDPNKPLVVRVDHGSTHNFKQVDASRGNIDNYLGKGFYGTDSTEDAGTNYAGEGPDLTSRIESRAEEMGNDIENMNDDEIISQFGKRMAKKLIGGRDAKYGTPKQKAYSEALKDIARKELHGGSPATYRVWIKMNKPLVLEKGGGTRFDALESYDEESDSFTENPDSMPMKLYDSIHEIAHDYNVDPQKLWGELNENLGNDWDGVTAYDVDAAMRKSEELMDATDENGKLASTEFIKEAFRGMGFDGIVMDADEAFGNSRKMGRKMAMDYGTRHYVVFEPEQVKSATGNKGTFDPENPDMTMMPSGGAKRTWFVRDGRRVYHKRQADGKFAPKLTLAGADFPAVQSRQDKKPLAEFAP